MTWKGIVTSLSINLFHLCSQFANQNNRRLLTNYRKSILNSHLARQDLFMNRYLPSLFFSCSLSCAFWWAECTPDIQQKFWVAIFVLNYYCLMYQYIFFYGRCRVLQCGIFKDFLKIIFVLDLAVKLSVAWVAFYDQWFSDGLLRSWPLAMIVSRSVSVIVQNGRKVFYSESDQNFYTFNFEIFDFRICWLVTSYLGRQMLVNDHFSFPSNISYLDWLYVEQTKNFLHRSRVHHHVFSNDNPVW